MPSVLAEVSYCNLMLAAESLSARRTGGLSNPQAKDSSFPAVAAQLAKKQMADWKDGRLFDSEQPLADRYATALAGHTIESGHAGLNTQQSAQPV